uniref:Uncharacterized protein n=1 Tax=Schistocephalus solidus TaxID=70667 RepID=A0A0X3PWL5_SCHSO
MVSKKSYPNKMWVRCELKKDQGVSSADDDDARKNLIGHHFMSFLGKSECKQDQKQHPDCLFDGVSASALFQKPNYRTEEACEFRLKVSTSQWCFGICGMFLGIRRAKPQSWQHCNNKFSGLFIR